ncbi:MAG: hypothetical protein RL414_682, partial [Actinomycetota bacterium]
GVGAAALVALTLNYAPTVAQAAPACKVGPVTQCVGATSDGAPYVMQVPANFNGTAFLFSHGYRYNIELPALGYPKVLNTPVPAPGDSVAKITEVATYLLSKGYAVFGSGFARQGWNADSGIATDVELIKTFKTQFTATKHVAAWGESLGGFITQGLAEQHPELVDAVAPLCMAAGSVEAEMTMAGDFLWGVKMFFDPSIKGGNYAAGAAGVAEATVDLGKVIAVFTKLSKTIPQELVTGKPVWPDTAPAAISGSGIPARSALLLVGLMSGIPTQSAHFDGTTGPGSVNSSSYTGFALAGSPALAILENGSTAAALGVLVTADLENQAGGAIFDNSKTDYAARVADESGIFNAGLSGSSAIAGMLGYLKAAPRATASPAAVAKMHALASHTGKINVPTITMTGIADPTTPAGNAQWIAEKYAAQYEAQKNANIKAGKPRGAYALASIWGMTPGHYTKFDAASSPITSGVAPANGTNHCNFTVKQYKGVADLLASAAISGKLDLPGKVANVVRKMGGSIIDSNVKPPLLKFYQEE